MVEDTPPLGLVVELWILRDFLQSAVRSSPLSMERGRERSSVCPPQWALLPPEGSSRGESGPPTSRTLHTSLESENDNHFKFSVSLLLQ